MLSYEILIDLNTRVSYTVIQSGKNRSCPINETPKMVQEQNNVTFVASSMYSMNIIKSSAKKLTITFCNFKIFQN